MIELGTSTEIRENIPNDSKATFIVYYQGLLAVGSILIFFTRLDVYLQDFGSVLPLYWLLGFLGLSVPLFFFLLRNLERISANILLWAVAYTAVSFILVLIQPRFPDLQYIENHYRTIVFLIMAIAIFSYHPLVFKWTKLSILGVTVLNVGMFAYEFVNPLAFHLQQRAPGRSSAFYDDSNTAAIALVVGMILTIDMFKPKYRLFYTFFIFIGLALTFSRGGLAGWALIVGILLLSKAIPRYQISLLVTFFAATIVVLSTQLNNLAYLETADGEKLFREDTLARVEFLIDPFAQKDDSQASRIHHIEDAWRKFQTSPFIGNGLGSGENTATVSQVGKAQRSHNTYLDLMVEFGFLGILIFPSLLWSCIREAKGAFRIQGIAFVIFMLSQGFFSHTLLSEFCSLMFYPIVANFSRQSYFANQKLQKSLR